MSLNQKSAVERAKQDLAGRLNISQDDIELVSVTEKDFPDASLGAPVEDEMSAMMIQSGWQVNLKADGKVYDYRASKYEMRLSNHDGENHIIKV